MISKISLLFLVVLFHFSYSCLPLKSTCTTQAECCYPALCLQYSTGKKCGIIINSSHNNNNNNNSNIMNKQLEKSDSWRD